MRKLPAIALAALVAAVGGTAVAAHRANHVMTVALPDGTSARVEYVGDVAPKVTVLPSAPVSFEPFAPLASFAGFDRMIEQMNRATEAMMREAQQAAVQPGAGIATPMVASFGNSPQGFTSTSIVSYSNGKSTCTRSTTTVSQGPGKPPKVSSTVSGNCATGAAAPAPNAPRLDHT